MPAGLAIVFALGFCGLFTALAVLIGRVKGPVNPEKLKPFECGSEPIGSPRGRYSVKFYQVAILFLVFDIEAAFMYPWAVLYNQLSRNAMGGVSFFGFAEMLIFVAILVVALAYVWRKKAIGWE
jgi:NADH-quinone oxidoreductase subunit A